MIIDTSAVLDILRDGPEVLSCAQTISLAATRIVSDASFREAAIVSDASHDPISSRRLDDLFRVANIVIEPVTAEQALLGREAYGEFGKGSGHPAQLNIGDCMAYALAMITGEPVLFKGDDIAQNDVIPAIGRP